LQGYGGPDSSPAADLVLVQDVLAAYLYTIKVPDALPTAGNREIVSALSGDNPYRIRFIDPPIELLNPDGELTDRWGTPLFFHFVEAGEPAIRSAGPDRQMWTGDDLLNGEFAGETR
ncbi:MAG: hypothetical protein HKO57_00710, partial [Akkermansiaceae bacterium]|nr:hypothetical protein [Akkermansiaceae bacterium]